MFMRSAKNYHLHSWIEGTPNYNVPKEDVVLIPKVYAMRMVDMRMLPQTS